MRKNGNTVLRAVLIGLLGLVVGFFIGQFFDFLGNNVEFLSFMSLLNYYTAFGPKNINLDLIFARLNFGFSLNFSIMGVVTMLLFLLFYFKRR